MTRTTTITGNPLNSIQRLRLSASHWLHELMAPLTKNKIPLLLSPEEEIMIQMAKNYPTLFLG